MKKLMVLAIVMKGLFILSLALNAPVHAQENPLLDQNFWGKYDSGDGAWVHATSADVARVIEGGADVYGPDEHGWTPLHYAARVGTEEAIEVLLEAINDKEGAINTLDEDNHTPLHHAARWNVRHPDVVQLLLDQGAKVDVLDKEDYTPLLAAAKWNTNPLAVQAFLDLDARMVEFAGIYGMMPLHYAAANNAPEVVRLLLERGAKVNAWSSFGKPLELARQFNRNPKVEELLLEYAAWD